MCFLLSHIIRRNVKILQTAATHFPHSTVFKWHEICYIDFSTLHKLIDSQQLWLVHEVYGKLSPVFPLFLPISFPLLYIPFNFFSSCFFFFLLRGPTSCPFTLTANLQMELERLTEGARTSADNVALPYHFPFASKRLSVKKMSGKWLSVRMGVGKTQMES